MRLSERQERWLFRFAFWPLFLFLGLMAGDLIATVYRLATAQAANAEPAPARHTVPVPVPVPQPGGNPAQNAAALQRLIDQAQPGVPFRIDLGPGQYEIASAIRVPADRWVVIDGGGVSQLYRTGYGPVFTLTPSDQWDRGRFTLRGMWAISGSITTDGPVQLDHLTIAGCGFYPGPGSYGIDLATGYCVQPHISDCVFHGGGLRWRYSRDNPEGEPHASSGLTIERCRVNATADTRPGPDIWLEGHHQATVRQVISEGLTAGWANGVDPATFGYAVGVFVDAPGPRGGSLESVWCEYWNYSGVPGAGPGNPTGRAADVLVRNPYSGSAGAYSSGAFRLTDVYGSGPVRISAVPDALDVAIVDVRGGSEPVADGPVVVRRWLTDALERRALQGKSPAWDWR